MSKSIKSTQARRTMATRSNARRRNNNAKKQRLMVIVVLLAIALVGTIGVAVAAFSSNLQINGVATVKSTVWDIHFENLKPVDVVGDRAKEVTTPQIVKNTNNVEATAIRDYEVELKDPGDTIEYTFDVVNKGDLDAQIATITIRTGSDLTCDSESDNNTTTRNENVCKHLNYTLKYADGTTVAVGDKLPHSDGQNQKTMKLKLAYDSNIAADELPDKDVSVSGLDVVIVYEQTTAI